METSQRDDDMMWAGRIQGALTQQSRDGGGSSGVVTWRGYVSSMEVRGLWCNGAVVVA